MSAPSRSADFDRAYSAPLTPWGDVRIPPELRRLVREENPRSSLELGCGVGRFSRFAAEQGLTATGVDFSPVAIEKAKARVAHDEQPASFQVEDVTRLEGVNGPFDIAFDVGCFHCLDEAGQRLYLNQVARVLRPRGRHLIWALDHSPSDLDLTPDWMRAIAAPHFELVDAQPSRRRLVKSHWYWLSKTR